MEIRNEFRKDTIREASECITVVVLAFILFMPACSLLLCKGNRMQPDDKTGSDLHLNPEAKEQGSCRPGFYHLRRHVLKGEIRCLAVSQQFFVGQQVQILKPRLCCRWDKRKLW